MELDPGQWVMEAQEVMREGNPGLLSSLQADPAKWRRWKADLEAQADEMWSLAMVEFEDQHPLPKGATYQQQVENKAQAMFAANSLVRETLIRPLGIPSPAG